MMRNPIFHDSDFQDLTWRNIGPFLGGRVTAVAGVAGAPDLFIAGAAGGGIWRTDDAGRSWRNLSDGWLGSGSVGALAVAGSGPGVIYAGMGEAQIRGTATTHGDGVYRSDDGGETWRSLGLAKTRHISRIRVDPRDPDTVWVAAQGLPWKPTAERGVYRTGDGGKSWARTLFVGETVGASDLIVDPADPDTLYAAMWDHQRFPWRIRSGGPGSGVYRSRDGGASWTPLTDGLPAAMGKIGLAISPARPGRIWAAIESAEGELFRSEDGGVSWTCVSRGKLPRARAWYYTKIVADPLDGDRLFVLHDPLLRSDDGGVSFRQIETPHSDHHDLWIDPERPGRMVVGNDGGACVTVNGGASWSSLENQPTGQFYRVAADRCHPYRVYGAQQDWVTVAIASRARDGGIGAKDCYTVGGCENAYIAFDPERPKLVYASCCGGALTECDVETGRIRNISPYPALALGSEPRSLKYRFNWNAPVIVSQHDPEVLYHAGNVVFRSRDRGRSWDVASPSLTRDEPDKQGAGGGPITNEASGAETYNTIASLAESPHRAGVLWAGSDDGLVHRTEDDGRSWRNVTPPDLGEALVNAIEISPHDPATVYLAVNRYRFGDFTPCLFKTEDNGDSWTRVVEGMAADAATRVVREDPSRAGLLYAGAETGMYLSFDGGGRWRPFQGNLPRVPITDLAIRRGDLIAATQGRAFWILDDLSPLRQHDEASVGKSHLFRPRTAYRIDINGTDETFKGLGENPPNGAIVYFRLADRLFQEQDAPAVRLAIHDATGKLVRQYGGSSPMPRALKPGLNRLVWDLRVDSLTPPTKRFILPAPWSYRVGPGVYEARLTVAGDTCRQRFELRMDPHSGLAEVDFSGQQGLLADIRQTLAELFSGLAGAIEARDSVARRLAKTDDQKETERLVGELAKIEAWADFANQPDCHSLQDVIRVPHRLDAQLLYLMLLVDAADPPPTEAARARFAELEARWRMLRGQSGDWLKSQSPGTPRR